MLNSEELRKILENKYNRNDWYTILRQNFNVGVLRENPPPIVAVIGNEFRAVAYELGEFDTTDGFKVGIYEVDVPDVKQIYRNKVGLRKLLQNVYTTTVDAALIVFTHGDKWRFSYVSEITTRNIQTGIRESVKTDAKRYTYLFGKNEKAKTAADNFAKVQQNDATYGYGTTLLLLKDTFNVEKMSKDFFNEYRKHYGAFLSYLIGKNEDDKTSGTATPLFTTIFNADEKRARDFVKKMLGRIVFLYFLEKKGWLGVPEHEIWSKGDLDFLRNLFNDSKHQSGFYPLILEPLFHHTLNEVREGDFFAVDASLFNKPGYDKLKIPFLNGGLFEPETYDTSSLIFPAELFKNLFIFFDRYNFTVYEDSPEEHTVAVDPEMLGHIFENLLEDNKDKGAFYTPKEIVHYMCQESLIEYLFTKCKNEHDEELRNGLERFIKNQELGNIAGYEEAILVALRDVKICDPAIGSGAFPMGILQEIFHAVETLNFAIEDTTERVWALENGWNPAKIKLSIIENSIYGVDIEPGAVDIARLRFWLSLVVDEIKPQPLPNLDYKIMQGNSLLSKFENEVIDIDWEVTVGTENTRKLQIQIQENLKKLLKKQKQFFNYNGDKKKLHAEIRSLKIDVLISQLDLDKYKYDRVTAKTGNLFDETKKEKQKSAEIILQVAGHKNIIKKLERLKKHPEQPLNFFDWKLSFPEVLNPVLKENEYINSSIGFDIVIGNPPYVSAVTMARNEELKRYFKRKYPLATGAYDLYILFLLKAKDIISNKGVYTWIIPNKFLISDYAKKTKADLIENNGLMHTIDVSVFNVFKGIGVYPIIILGCKNYQGAFANFELTNYENLTQRIFTTRETLQPFSLFEQLGIKINSGATGFQAQQLKLAIFNVQDDKSIPFAVSGNIDRYTWSNQSVRYMGERYFQAYISNKNSVVADSKWKFWQNPKIVIAGMTKVIEAVYVESPLGIGVGCYGIYDFGNYDPYCLTAVLNSKYMTNYFVAKFKDKHLAGGYLAINKSTIEGLPLVPISKATQEILCILSKDIHNKTRDNENTTQLQRKIDVIVFKLFNISFSEVMEICPNYSIDEHEYYKLNII